MPAQALASVVMRVHATDAQETSIIVLHVMLILSSINRLVFRIVRPNSMPPMGLVFNVLAHALPVARPQHVSAVLLTIS